MLQSAYDELARSVEEWRQDLSVSQCSCTTGACWSPPTLAGTHSPRQRRVMGSRCQVATGADLACQAGTGSWQPPGSPSSVVGVHRSGADSSTPSGTSPRSVGLARPSPGFERLTETSGRTADAGSRESLRGQDRPLSSGPASTEQARTEAPGRTGFVVATARRREWRCGEEQTCGCRRPGRGRRCGREPDRRSSSGSWSRIEPWSCLTPLTAIQRRNESIISWFEWRRLGRSNHVNDSGALRPQSGSHSAMPAP